MITKRYDYTITARDSKLGSKNYILPSGKKLPSISAILDKTKSEEARKALMEWKNKMGHEEAQRITVEASLRGSKMHSFLEYFIFSDVLLNPGTDPNKIQSSKMAKTILYNGFKNVDEIWGSEVSLYYPELYNGTTDMVGVWKGKPAIIDFKQTNKPKKREWVTDYFCQLAAYSLAHDEIFNTKIKTGVVLMCSQNLDYQEFVIDEDELIYWQHQWWDKVEQFYNL